MATWEISTDTMRDRIRDALPTSLVVGIRHLGLPVSWERMNVSPRKAADAEVFATTLWPGRMPLVVKRFRRASDARLCCERQRRAARRYGNTLEWINLDRFGLCMTMPRAPGRPALAALRNQPFDTVFEGPVRWLGAVHRRSPRKARKIAVAQPFRFKFLHRVTEEFPWATGPHAIWQDHATGLGSRPASCVHGDFHPGNIIVDKSGFTLIDFDGNGTGSAELELAGFLNRVQLHCVSKGRDAESRIWPSWRRKIFDWYGYASAAEDPALAAAMQYQRLCSLRRAASLRNTKKRNARLAFLRERLSRSPDRISEVLD